MGFPCHWWIRTWFHERVNFRSERHVRIRMCSLSCGRAHREEAGGGVSTPGGGSPWLKSFGSSITFLTLDAAERDALLDALARFGARMFSPQDATGSGYQELVDIPAYAKHEEARNRPAAYCGTRYYSCEEHGFVQDATRTTSSKSAANFHTLANFQPRPDLMPRSGLVSWRPKPPSRRKASG